MDSIKKLVSENVTYKLNYFLISTFLKDIGWWGYWKEYIPSYDFARHSHNYVDGCWVKKNSPYSVFGCCSFSAYLVNNKNIDVYTVTSVFMSFIRLTCPKYYKNTCEFKWGALCAEDFILNRYKPGIVDKWKKTNLDYKVEKILNIKL